MRRMAANGGSPLALAEPPRLPSSAAAGTLAGANLEPAAPPPAAPRGAAADDVLVGSEVGAAHPVTTR